jgi:integrase
MVVAIEIRYTYQAPTSRKRPARFQFHSLRHSAVTMVKAPGVSDFIASEIVGHESAAVSRQYTHLTTDDKRVAMQRLPDMRDT